MATDKKTRTDRPKADTLNLKKLYLLFTIVNRNKAEFYADALQYYHVNMQTTLLANGTASSQMLGSLGLTGREKAVVISVIEESRIPKALDNLETKFRTIRGGNGIAFTVPLSSVMGVAIYRFLSDNRMQVKEEKQ